MSKLINISLVFFAVVLMATGCSKFEPLERLEKGSKGDVPTLKSSGGEGIIVTDSQSGITDTENDEEHDIDGNITDTGNDEDHDTDSGTAK